MITVTVTDVPFGPPYDAYNRDFSYITVKLVKGDHSVRLQDFRYGSYYYDEWEDRDVAMAAAEKFAAELRDVLGGDESPVLWGLYAGEFDAHGLQYLYSSKEMAEQAVEIVNRARREHDDRLRDDCDEYQFAAPYILPLHIAHELPEFVPLDDDNAEFVDDGLQFT